MFSYYITTHFITNNKDYNSYRNPHSVYQMCPKSNATDTNYFTTFLQIADVVLVFSK